MQKVIKNGLHFWEFDLLKNIPEIIHGSFLRHGGVSQGPFTSLNTSFDVGDKPEDVQENLNRIQKTLGLKALKSTIQCHGSDAHLIKDLQSPILSCDALITKLEGVGLLIKSADCQAALLYDPVQKVIAAVHAGWKGSVQKIYSKTILNLKETFGTKPENLLVCISPSLGPEKGEFKNYKEEFPEWLWQFQVKPNYFDLWEASKAELVKAGVLPHHIEIAGECTNTLSQDYFSYRSEKISGRLATVIGLNVRE